MNKIVMKKYVALITTLILVLSLIGCGINQDNESKNYYDFETYMTDDERQTLIDEDVVTLLYASPYYNSPINNFGLADTSYNDSRDEIINNLYFLGNTIEESATEIIPYIDLLQASVMKMMDNYSDESNLNDYIEFELHDYTNYMINISLASSQIEEFSETDSDLYTQAWYDTMKLINQVELGNDCVDFLTQLSVDTAFILDYLEENEMEINTDTSNAIDIIKNSQDYEDAISEIIVSLDTVAFYYSLLDESEFYFTLSNFEYMKGVTTELQNRISESSTTVDEEIMNYTEESIEFYKDLAKKLEEAYIANTSYEIEIDISNSNNNLSLFSTVYAAENDELKNANEYYKKAVSVNSKKYESKNDIKLSLWDRVTNSVSKHYNGFKKMTGHIIEIGNVLVKDTMDYAVMSAYGIEKETIKNQISENHELVRQKYKANTLGEETINNINGVYEGMEEFSQNASEMVFGEGKISDSIGFLGRYSTKLVTGLGRSVVQLVNPKSTPSEQILAGLSIALTNDKIANAFTGGFFSATQKLIPKSLQSKIVTNSSAFKNYILTKADDAGKWFSNTSFGKKAIDYSSKVMSKHGNIITKAKDKLVTFFTGSKKSENALLKSKSKIVNTAGKIVQVMEEKIKSDINKGVKDYANDLIISKSTDFIKWASSWLDPSQVTKGGEVANSSSSNDTEDDVDNDDSTGDDEGAEKEEIEDSTNGDSASEDKISDNNDADSNGYAGTYVGNGTKISVGNDFSSSLDKNTSSVELVMDKNLMIKVKLNIFNTGMMDTTASFQPSVPATINNDNFSIQFTDDEGDLVTISGKFSGTSLNGKVVNKIEGDTVTIQFVSKLQ